MSKKVIDPEPIIRKLADSRCGFDKNAICKHCDTDAFCGLYSNDAVVWKCNCGDSCKDYAKVAVDEDNE